MTQVKKAVILAGGLGTRFLPASKAYAKEMFPVYDKPILQYLVEELTKAGIEEVLLVLGKGKEAIIRHFTPNPALKERLLKDNQLDLLKKVEEIDNFCKVKFVKNVAPKGAGYALSKAKKFVKNEPFVLLVGDEIGHYKGKNSIEQMLDVFKTKQKTIVGVKRVPKELMVNYGMVEGKAISKNSFLMTNMVEKPKLEQVTSDLAAVGKYILMPQVFSRMEALAKERQKPLDYNAVLFELAKAQDAIAAVIDYDRYDTGSKFGFVQANLDFALMDKNLRPQVIEYLKKITKEF